MTTKRKAKPLARKYRARIEIPAEADDAVVKALHVVAAALGVEAGDLSESATASPDSYSVTIHALPIQGGQS